MENTIWSPVKNKTDEDGNPVYRTDEEGNILYEEDGVTPIRATVQVHGGVIRDNVTFDKDGNLILIANGDYYVGDKKGIVYGSDFTIVSGGQRTGAVITSTKTYGPGSFEVEMKLPAFNGICSSLWLFNYFADPDDASMIYNHEIDIEIHGTTQKGVNLSHPMFTSWVTERKSHSDFANLSYSLADGKFHKYRIEWHTGEDPYIEYYIDDVLYCTQRQSELHTIPTNEMYVNIGCWFPFEWCGEPDFETDYMVVKSFTYTPFEGETAGKVNSTVKNSGGWTNNVAVPEKNLIANGNFAYDITANDAWKVLDGGTATVDNGNLTLDGTLVQNVYMECVGQSYSLTVLGDGNANVKVTYMSLLTNEELGSVEGNLGETITLATPANCTQLKIEIVSDGEVTLTKATLNVNVAA